LRSLDPSSARSKVAATTSDNADVPASRNPARGVHSPTPPERFLSILAARSSPLDPRRRAPCSPRPSPTPAKPTQRLLLGYEATIKRNIGEIKSRGVNSSLGAMLHVIVHACDQRSRWPHDTSLDRCDGRPTTDPQAGTSTRALRRRRKQFGTKTPTVRAKGSDHVCSEQREHSFMNGQPNVLSRRQLELI